MQDEIMRKGVRAVSYTHLDVYKRQAQLGEHHVRNVGVVGSNPIISTTEI